MFVLCKVFYFIEHTENLLNISPRRVTTVGKRKYVKYWCSKNTTNIYSRLYKNKTGLEIKMNNISRIIVCIQFSKRMLCTFKPETILTAENKSRFIDKFSKVQRITGVPKEPTRNAAILVPLCHVNNELSLLYTLRAPDLKTHRGQVSFPGGMSEENDKTVEQTALRETTEELGLDEKYVEVWCKGNPIVSIDRRIIVTPIVGYIKDPVDPSALKINETEVKKAFAISLQNLCKPGTLHYTQFKNGYSLPVFLGGERRIWGLTAIVTHFFLASLLSKEVYQHKIKCVREVQI